MPLRRKLIEYPALLRYLAKWVLITAPVAVAIGSAVALFLRSLEVATETRFAHPWLLFLLPLAGLLVGLLYHAWGRSVEAGNNLIIDQIHEPGGGVPARMAPLVLIGTVVTHLFGGSAGREGTAVQMGGSLASTLGRWLRLNEAETRTLLMVGVAAGFGAVFGTPLTGAVFALEVLVIGRMESESIVPALLGSVIGYWTVGAWGVHHTLYRIAGIADLPRAGGIFHVSWPLLLKVAAAAVAFGLASVLFAELTHGLHRLWKRVIRWPVLRPFVGGLAVIALVYLVGTPDYLGLGVSSPDPHGVSILSSFHAGGATPLSWLWKTIFTAVTLSSGFKGGEVTPLFFVGATLGNALAGLLHAPVDLLAGIGFIAVFAGATNTPLACTIMGVELFGAEYTLYFAVACFLAYLFSGHSGIYLSQRVGHPKSLEIPVLPETSLRAIQGQQPLTTFSVFPDLSNPSIPEMPHRHTIVTTEMGLVRVYLSPRDRFRTGNRLFGRSRVLYREIVQAAKRDAIPTAMVHHTQYGFAGHSDVTQEHVEYGFAGVNLYVELIGPWEQLEFFCRKHAELLKGKVIIHKRVEGWGFETVPDEVTMQETA
jgi:H+/Cl- antiporter ClcA